MIFFRIFLYMYSVCVCVCVWVGTYGRNLPQNVQKKQIFNLDFFSVFLHSPRRSTKKKGFQIENFSLLDNWWPITVRAEIFAVVLFSRISRVKPSRKFPLQFMSIYSNDNISKIAKLTSRELPHLAKTAKIMAYTVV